MMSNCTRRHFILASLLLSYYCALSGSALAATVFTEDFEGTTNGENLTTSNTALTYIRIGSGGGAISAISPGIFGTGNAAAVTQNTPSGSLNGLGVADSLPSSNVYELTLNFRLTDLSGDLVMGVGSGSSFTGASTFSTSQGLFWLQSDSGNFERRTGSGWSDVGGGTSLQINTNYSLRVLANGSSAPMTYIGGSLAANSMDIYLNGSILDDDVTVTTPGLFANGFRMYQVNQGNFQVDNIALFDSLPVPEPSSLTLAGLGLVAGGWLARRRRLKARRTAA